MRKYVLGFALAPLLGLAACSTTPVQVKTETVLRLPSKNLRQRCDKPLTVPAQTNDDIASNSRQRKVAYEKCEARMDCLIDWLDMAEKNPDEEPAPGTCAKF